jgi:hypothetical protein
MLEQYQSILDGIQTIEPLAHIAGGAVRDTILERPIKDIDVFLENERTDTAAQMLRSEFGYVKTGEWASYREFSDPAVIRLAKFERADETIPLCLIGLNEPKSMQANVERFDFGICMVAWDGVDVYKAELFDEDVANHTFTLSRADNQPQFNYSMSRFKKMTADRYQGYTLSVPEEFEEFVREHAFHSNWYYDYHDRDDAIGNRLKPKDR